MRNSKQLVMFGLVLASFVQAGSAEARYYYGRPRASFGFHRPYYGPSVVVHNGDASTLAATTAGLFVGAAVAKENVDLERVRADLDKYQAGLEASDALIQEIHSFQENLVKDNYPGAQDMSFDELVDLLYNDSNE